MLEIILISIFVLGYLAIATEHSINLNKSASALFTAVLLWSVYIMFEGDKEAVNEHLVHHLGELSGILFFLLGAMTIVEVIDSHDGFDLVTARITQTNKVKLLWILGFITFFLSSMLDNLTTTIVIVSLLRKMIKDKDDRLFFAGIVVIAANAGGAWSPIGDVTTTMLWIGGQITAGKLMISLIIPSIVSLAVPLIYLSFKLKGNIERPKENLKEKQQHFTERQQMIVFAVGLGSLIMVPVFKTVTHLPPYMGVLLGLSVLWIVTELLHMNKEDHQKHGLMIAHSLQKIDTSSILFFLGILLSVSALQTVGVLTHAANWMTETINNDTIVVMGIGILSSIVDNVPLVAAAQGMYSLDVYPVNAYFWEFLAFAAGTGGSILIIGSAAGVAAMGMEKINFFWYVKNISLLALLGYFAGAFVYIIQTSIFH